jgi:hypothetical protein
MDGIEITFEGIPEFSRMMTDLAGPVAERIIRHAVREGGRVVQAAITEAAPVRPDLPSGTALPPGALQGDIQVAVTKDGVDSFSAWIYPGKFSRAVAIWVEWGHRLIRGKSRKGSSGRVIGDVPAHPYIRPAFDANEDLAFEAVADSLATDINAAAKAKGLNAGR